MRAHICALCNFRFSWGTCKYTLACEQKSRTRNNTLTYMDVVTWIWIDWTSTGANVNKFAIYEMAITLFARTIHSGTYTRMMYERCTLYVSHLELRRANKTFWLQILFSPPSSSSSSSPSSFRFVMNFLRLSRFVRTKYLSNDSQNKPRWEWMTLLYMHIWTSKWINSETRACRSCICEIIETEMNSNHFYENCNSIFSFVDSSHVLFPIDSSRMAVVGWWWRTETEQVLDNDFSGAAGDVHLDKWWIQKDIK